MTGADSAPEMLGFYELATAWPDRNAVTFTDGGSISYGTLYRRVNQISRALQKFVDRGDRIAAIVPNGLAWFEIILAAGQIGVSVIPVNPDSTPSEVDYLVRDSVATAVVADAEIGLKLEAAGCAFPAIRFLVSASAAGWRPWDEFGSGEEVSPPLGRCAGQPMGYTSGTTGRPKGIARDTIHLSPEQAAQGSAVLLELFSMTPGPGVHLCCSPLYHAAPAFMAVGALHLGHSVICMPKFDAASVLGVIDEFRVTSTHMVPTHFHRLLRLAADTRANADTSSLQAVVHAGAQCPVETKEAMLEWLGPVVYEYYGATEGTVTSCTPEQAAMHPGTVGLPLPWVTVHILDENKRMVPAGVDGLVYFRMLGNDFSYYNDETKTLAARAGDFITLGDIGNIDVDGFLYLSDRRDDVIISGGVNIYPAEVEARLIAHPRVADVAVIGIPDPEWGSVAVAVVELDSVSEVSPTVDELRDWCAAGLAKIKCPNIFYFADKLPRTEIGKLLRRKVRDQIHTSRYPAPTRGTRG